MPPIARRPLLLGAALAPLAAPRLAAQTGPHVALALLSDLHSAQEGAAATLALLDRLIAETAPTPLAIAINGDVFERGNAIALRSDGAADWAFLAALRRRAPVVLNIGNHEGALVEDIEVTVARARAAGIAVVSNLRRRADNAPIAEPAVTLAFANGRRLTCIGIATDEALTYRAPVRERLAFPPPAAWGRDNLPALLAGADAIAVLSHAGIAADRALLPLLPPGALLLGGHEHLTFDHAERGVAYRHTGSWNREVSLARFGAPGEAPAVTARRVRAAEGEDAAHAATWREVRAAFGQPQDFAVLFRLAEELPLGLAARRAVAACAAAAGGGTGLMAHTSFGTGLPAGEVTQLDFDAFLRFDGPLFRGAASPEQAALIAARANQDGDTALAARTGDFVHAAPLPLTGPLVANGWVRLNAERYLGAAIAMAEVPELRIKSVVAAALRSG
jgi:2',3'-cyclic-nucleotide 2'-phosphodiesterase (5'-nucleotidase family)